jgi:hypothetical protein
VQWNPVDEQCVFIKLLQGTATDNQIKIDGMVFAVEAAARKE